MKSKDTESWLYTTASFKPEVCVNCCRSGILLVWDSDHYRDDWACFACAFLGEGAGKGEYVKEVAS